MMGWGTDGRTDTGRYLRDKATWKGRLQLRLHGHPRCRKPEAKDQVWTANGANHSD